MRVKNILILVVLAAFGFSAAAQQAKLQVSNLAPRVGDEIAVSVVYYDANQPEKERHPYSNNLARADFQINKLINEEGSLWIGPFTFKVGDELFITDSIELQILAALPAKDTVLLRQVKLGTEEFLIVEQVLDNNSKKQFVSLQHSKVNGDLVGKEKMSTETSVTQHVNTHSKKVMVYTLQKNNYSGDTLITREHFKNIPSNITFNNYEIL